MGEEDTVVLIRALRVVDKLRSHVDAITRVSLAVSDEERRALETGLRRASSQWAAEYLEEHANTPEPA